MTRAEYALHKKTLPINCLVYQEARVDINDVLFVYQIFKRQLLKIQFDLWNRVDSISRIEHLLGRAISEWVLMKFLIIN